MNKKHHYPLPYSKLLFLTSAAAQVTSYELVCQVIYEFSLSDKPLSNQISNFQIKVEQVYSPDKTQNAKPNEWGKQEEQEF